MNVWLARAFRHMSKFVLQPIRFMANLPLPNFIFRRLWSKWSILVVILVRGPSDIDTASNQLIKDNNHVSDLSLFKSTVIMVKQYLL